MKGGSCIIYCFAPILCFDFFGSVCTFVEHDAIRCISGQSSFAKIHGKRLFFVPVPSRLNLHLMSMRRAILEFTTRKNYFITINCNVDRDFPTFRYHSQKTQQAKGYEERKDSCTNTTK